MKAWRGANHLFLHANHVYQTHSQRHIEYQTLYDINICKQKNKNKKPNFLITEIFHCTNLYSYMNKQLTFEIIKLINLKVLVALFQLMKSMLLFVNVLIAQK